MTINKTQDQSLKCDCIDLRTLYVSQDELEVGCTRAGKPDNLCIHVRHKQAKNVVYEFGRLYTNLSPICPQSIHQSAVIQYTPLPIKLGSLLFSLVVPYKIVFFGS